MPRWPNGRAVYDFNMEPQTAQPPAEANLPKYADTPLRVTVAAHELTIFVQSLPMIAALVQDIRTAQRRVWVESYIFLDDVAGCAVAEALKERARLGVDVRLLYDAIGCQWTPAIFFREMAEAGVQVHAFHSIWEALYRFSFLRVLNRRNHRKLVVLDDQVAYLGGMNLLDQGSAALVEHAEHLPVSAGWRDIHVRLAGPRQKELAESFERSWQRARGLPVERRPRSYRRAVPAPGQESIQFFDSGPGPKHTRAARVFTQLIRRARQRLALSMAYFLPVGPVLRQLLRAHRRGVFIQVVLPGQSDVPIVQRATRYLYRRLLRRRFHIYERQMRMLHSKLMIVDNQWTVLGSCNLDARSLYINYEILAVIHSRNLAKALGTLIQSDVEASQRVTLRSCLKQSWTQRLLDRLAWALRWWL
jgi:cardiolipin synthase